MHYHDYFMVDEAVAEFHEFLNRLFAFNLDMASQYGLRKPLADLEPQEQTIFDKRLNMATTAIKGSGHCK
jgi:hypothetical protein